MLDLAINQRRFVSAPTYRRKLIACGLLHRKRFYVKRNGALIFWRCGVIGGSFFVSTKR